jgi:hypothetical protein
MEVAMATLSIPAGASLPPAFTARERAKVDAYFGGARRVHPSRLGPRLGLPLFAALLAVTVVGAVLTA